jgi:hypothetical protein
VDEYEPVSYLNPAGNDPAAGAESGQSQSQQDPQIVVIPPGAGNPGGAGADSGSDGDPAAMVEQPAKVMRIGTMVKQLLEEVRAAPLDEEGRLRLRDIHSASIRELEDGLAPELREELDRLSLPFSDDRVPTEAELRIAQAQLVGWLEGLFHGIQTALFAQQMAAQAQLQQMRALPAGQDPSAGGPGPAMPGDGGRLAHGTGQYL